MASKIIDINTNSTLDSIIKNKSDGIVKKYLLDSDIKLKNQEILTFYKYIEVNNFEFFFKVKFPYGRRIKRIELVSKFKNNFYIYKISNKSNIDKDIFELDEIISLIKEKYNATKFIFEGFIGTTILPNNEVINSIQENLSNFITYIKY